MLNSLLEGILVIDVTKNKQTVFFANDIMQNLFAFVLDQKSAPNKCTKFQWISSNIDAPLMHLSKRDKTKSKNGLEGAEIFSLNQVLNLSPNDLSQMVYVQP